MTPGGGVFYQFGELRAVASAQGAGQLSNHEVLVRMGPGRTDRLKSQPCRRTRSGEPRWSGGFQLNGFGADLDARGGAVSEIHQLSGHLVGEPQQIGRARARHLYPAPRLRCQYRGHIIRVRSVNAKLLVNTRIIIKTLGQAADGLVLRQPR
jgi:hypothetical protein